MEYYDFIDRVRHRARMGSLDEAARISRVTLEVLGERLSSDVCEKIASSLPAEVGLFLKNSHTTDPFDHLEFFKRVGSKEGVDLPDAVHHSRAVVSVVCEAVPRETIKGVRFQLPAGFDSLFSHDDCGGIGSGPRNR